MMEIGDKVPDFLGTDENGNELRMQDFAGKKLVLYFYPKDSTPGCTQEACNLRDNYERMLAKGYAVVGVSVQDIARPFHSDAGFSLLFSLASSILPLLQEYPCP